MINKTDKLEQQMDVVTNNDITDKVYKYLNDYM